MPSIGSRAIIYDVFRIPAARRLQVPLALRREQIPQFLECLQATVESRRGAGFYYWPDETTYKARYEWDAKVSGRRSPLRLGAMMDVTADAVGSLELYVTTQEACALLLENPDLSDFVARQGIAEIEVVLRQAHHMMRPESGSDRWVVRYIEVPLGSATAAVSIGGQAVLIAPTVLLEGANRGKHVSAAVFRVQASNETSAKERALRQLTLFCGLATLAAHGAYKEIALKWPRGRKPLETLSGPSLPSNKLLYGKHRPVPALAPAHRTGARVNALWTAYQSLDVGQQEAVLQHVLAYKAAKEVEGAQPTLAVVAFTAVLSALTPADQRRCVGDLLCSHCGSISLRHNLVSESKAIAKRVADLLALDPKQEALLGDIVSRVYAKQRSAFVHGALLRHAEAEGSDPLAMLLPGSDRPVSELYLYRADLMTVASITRRALLASILRGAGLRAEDVGFSDIIGEGVRVRSKSGMCLSLGPRRQVQLRFRKDAPTTP